MGLGPFPGFIPERSPSDPKGYSVPGFCMVLYCVRNCHIPPYETWRGHEVPIQADVDSTPGLLIPHS